MQDLEDQIKDLKAEVYDEIIVAENHEKLKLDTLKKIQALTEQIRSLEKGL